MLRRFVLCGLMVLVPGMLQVVLGLLLSAVFLLVQVQASPYTDMADDFLASSSSFGRALQPSRAEPALQAVAMIPLLDVPCSQ